MDAAEQAMILANLARDHAIALRAIFDANDDLPRRLATLEKKLVYDAEDDYFAIVIGPPVEAITESLANAILFRVEPETLKIVGIEIYDFEERRKNAPAPWAAMIEYWAPVVEALRSGQDGSEALSRVVEGRSLREIVPA